MLAQVVRNMSVANMDAAARVPSGCPTLSVIPFGPSHPWFALLWPRALLHQGRVAQQGRSARSRLDSQRPLHRRALRTFFCFHFVIKCSLFGCICDLNVQASMKLPIFACEEFGVHVVKYMQKV